MMVRRTALGLGLVFAWTIAISPCAAAPRPKPATPSQAAAAIPLRKPPPPLRPGLVATIGTPPGGGETGMAPLIWREVRTRPAFMGLPPLGEAGEVRPLAMPQSVQDAPPDGAPSTSAPAADPTVEGPQPHE